MLQDFAKRRKVTLKELQSLIGSLNFACLVVSPGRAFLRRLIDRTCGVVKPHHRIRLRKEDRADIKAWSLFIENFNGRAILHPNLWLSSDTIKLSSDAASTVGFAAVFGKKWFMGVWPVFWKLDSVVYHINLMELVPVVLALEIWGALLANHSIIFLCDNMTTVYGINKLTSRDKQSMALIRRLTIVLMKYNILLKAKHIPGRCNITADLLSRLQVAEAKRASPELAEFPTVIPAAMLPWTEKR